MKTVTFKAFSGIDIEAQLWGEDDQPSILLLAQAAPDQSRWQALADALCVSGRRVILLPTDDANPLSPKHVRAVLAGLSSRPAVVAIGAARAAAQQALEKDGGHLAVGLCTVGLGEALQASDTEDAHPAGVPAVHLGAAAAISAGDTGGADGDDLPDGEQALFGDEALLGALLGFLEIHQPLAAREFRNGSDPRTLRDAMGCFATGVTIITAFNDEDVPIGLTANSFTSVSLDPPLLLVCIAKSSSSAKVMENVSRFGVNVLHIGQQATSSRFASKVEDRFEGIDWSTGETNVPMLDSALVAFECEQHSLHDAGDHFILVGRVHRAQFEPHRDPLLFYRGKYRRLYFA